MRQTNPGFALKKQKIEEFWSGIIERASASKKTCVEFAMILEEIERQDIESDILQIWLELYGDTVVNPMVPFHLKATILQTILKNKLFMSPGSSQFLCLPALESFFKKIIETDSSHFSLLTLFLFDNLTTKEFKQEEFLNSLKHFNDIEYLLGGAVFASLRDLEAYIEDFVIYPLKAELNKETDVQYIELKVRLLECPIS
jgi:hypothetical protein